MIKSSHNNNNNKSEKKVILMIIANVCVFVLLLWLRSHIYYYSGDIISGHMERTRLKILLREHFFHQIKLIDFFLPWRVVDSAKKNILMRNIDYALSFSKIFALRTCLAEWCVLPSALYAL